MRVSSCCCFFSLKTGCLIIAMYYVILSIWLLISSSIDLYDILADDDDNAEPDVIEKERNPVIRGMLWTFLSIIALHAIVSFVLLLGVTKEIPVVIFIWIITNTVFLVAVVSGMSVRLFLDPRKFMASIGKRIFSVLIGIYFLVVVKSFHRDLKERQVEFNRAEAV